jgi:hypothetical protein
MDEIAKMITRDLDEDEEGRSMAVPHLGLETGFV